MVPDVIPKVIVQLVCAKPKIAETWYYKRHHINFTDVTMKLKERFVIRTEAHIAVGRTDRYAEMDVPLTAPAVRVIRDVSNQK